MSTRSAGPAVARHHLRRRGPGDHRRAAPPSRRRLRRDHRDRRGQGARRRGPRRARHAGRPGPQHPAADRRAHRDHHGDGVRRPDDRVGAAGVSGVLPRRGAGRPQRRLRHRVPARGRRALPDRLAPSAGAVHRAAGPPGAHPRRGAQRAAGGAGAAVRRRHHPDAPRPRRRPRHRRRAARADRAGRQPGRAHLHRAALVSARRDTGPAPQAVSRRRACRTGRACTCSADPRPRCSTSAPRWICADGSASTSPAPTRAPASRRWRRWPPRVDHVECAHDLEAGVRELRLLAAHAPPYNRRSKFPHRWWWVVLTDEAFPRFSAVRHAASATCARRPVPLPRRRRRDRRTAGPVHRGADLHDTAGPLGAARPRLPRTRTVAVPGAAAASPPPSTPRHPSARRRADRRCRTAARWRGAGAHHRPGRAATATRPPRGCAITPPPQSTCCGGVSGCARWRRSPNWWRRVRTATAAGTSR